MNDFNQRKFKNKNKNFNLKKEEKKYNSLIYIFI